MKNLVKYILQGALGYRRYLYYFALFKIRSLKNDRKEKDFFQFLSLMKNGNGLVLDVGANLGIMTSHLSKQLSEDKILAIEPMPDNVLVLKKIMEKKKLINVELHEVAVGEKPGMVTMILPDNRGVKMQGLSHIKHDSIEEWNKGEEFEVPMKTIDSIVGDRRVQGMKMDVENFEFYSLKGAEQMLRRDMPIIYMELWDNDNRKQCFDFLDDLGYEIFVVDKGELVKFDSDTHTAQNFIFIH